MVCFLIVLYLLMYQNDLRELLPHSKEDVKFSDKANLYEINEVCEMKNCTNCIFFECRKKKDLYIWMAKTPSGPSVKFHVTNSTATAFYF